MSTNNIKQKKFENIEQLKNFKVYSINNDDLYSNQNSFNSYAKAYSQKKNYTAASYKKISKFVNKNIKNNDSNNSTNNNTNNNQKNFIPDKNNKILTNTIDKGNIMKSFSLKRRHKNNSISKNLNKSMNFEFKDIKSSINSSKNSSISIDFKRKKSKSNRLDNLNIKNVENKNNISNFGNYFCEFLLKNFPFNFIEFNKIIFNLNEIIHYGDNCILYKGKYLHNEVCIKEFKNMNKIQKEDAEKVKNEITISINLHHKNIINTIGYSFNNQKTKIFLIFEYMKNKNLKYFIEKNKNIFQIKQKLKLIYEISLAIEYLHLNNIKIIHRDIKSSNILLDNDLHCKLCDFGMSKYYDNKNENIKTKIENNYKTNSQSTLFWMAPEYLCDGIFNSKSDIYSFGILIWEIFMEDTNPYKNVNINDYLLGNKDVVYKQRPLINEENFNECKEIKELMTSMWEQNPKKRPSIEKILNFLENLNKKYDFL